MFFLSSIKTEIIQQIDRRLRDNRHQLTSDDLWNAGTAEVWDIVVENQRLQAMRKELTGSVDFVGNMLLQTYA